MTTFDVAAVRAAVAGTRFADVRWVAETGSTNADLMALAGQGEPGGIVLGADHQTAGRGRRGRTWEAPPGAAVLVSVLLRPPVPTVELVTPAVAVAAAEAVEEVTGTAPGIKWPNDLVVPDPGGGVDRKLAGILAEAAWPPGADIASGWRPASASVRVPVVVGLGLNVRSAGRPSDLDGLAIACDEIADDAATVTREALVGEWLARLDRWYGVALGDPARLWEGWRARSATLGRRVRVDLGADDVEGTAVDVTERGALVVETLEGTTRTIAVGDVHTLRPAPG